MQIQGLTVQVAGLFSLVESWCYDLVGMSEYERRKPKWPGWVSFYCVFLSEFSNDTPRVHTNTNANANLLTISTFIPVILSNQVKRNELQGRRCNIVR